MPAKEEEVKKYRDAAIGNAAIVEGQNLITWTTLTIWI